MDLSLSQLSPSLLSVFVVNRIPTMGENLESNLRQIVSKIILVGWNRYVRCDLVWIVWFVWIVDFNNWVRVLAGLRNLNLKLWITNILNRCNAKLMGVHKMERNNIYGSIERLSYICIPLIGFKLNFLCVILGVKCSLKQINEFFF